MTENKDPAQIAFCLDKGYAYATQLAIFSLLRTNPQPLNIFILGYDLTDEIWRDFERIFGDFPNANLQAQPITSAQLSLPEHGRHYISSASYLRLTLTEYLSGRVTYLDGDILVRKSIEGFTGADLGEAYIGVVPDTVANRMYHRQVAAQKSDKMGDPQFQKEAAVLAEMLENTEITNPAQYFNAGLYTIDFDKLKANQDLHAQYQSIEGARTIGKGSDQRYLNYLFKDHLKILPFTYNSQMRNAKSIDPAIPQTEMANWIEARKDPAICHFLSKRKPWKSIWRNYSFSARHRFIEYRLMMRRLRKTYGIEFQA